jgi:hypothetical protein
LTRPDFPTSRAKTAEKKSEDELKDVCVARKFCVLLHNAQGLASPNKVSLLRDFVSSLTAAESPHVLLVTESWLNPGEAKAFCFANLQDWCTFLSAE